MQALDARGVGKRYGKTAALDDLNLSVRPGEVFGFLGANGAGKTTFTRCAAGLIRPTSGEVLVGGHDVRKQRKAALSRLGIVPDQYELYPELTAPQHLRLFGRLRGLRGDALESRIHETMRIIGMEPNADKPASAFSHGMKQRTCIGIAILHKPALIILDEPTNGLDPRGAFELRQLIRGLASQGCAVFLNSHVLSEVEQVCDRVAILHKGRLIAVGTQDELRARLGGTGGTRIRLANPSAALLKAAQAVVPGVRTSGKDALEVPGSAEVVSKALRAVTAAGGVVKGMESTGSSLEDAYLRLTGGP